MYYTEYLRIRKAVRVAAIVVALIAGSVATIMVWPGVTVGDSQRAHAATADASINVDTNGEVPAVVTAGPAKAKAGRHVHESRAAEIGDVVLATIAFTVFFTGIYGFTRGASLAAENRGHLPLVWTRPVARTRYALGVFGLNVVGIVVVDAICLILTGFVAALVLAVHHIALGPRVDMPSIAALAAMAIAFPLAWFGVLQAATASLRERAAAVTGLMWPIALVLVILQRVPVPPVSAALHVINFINPLSYTHLNISGGIVPTTAIFEQDAALAVLGLAGCVLAAWQWQRLEG